MNVLVLSDRYPPYHEGGYELNCWQITEHLRSLGHRCTVLTTRYGAPSARIEGHVQRILYDHALSTSRGLHRRLVQFGMGFQALLNYRMTTQLIQKLTPDFVFVGHMTSASILPILAAQDLGVCTIFRIGSHWLVHQKQRYVFEANRWKKWYRQGQLAFRDFSALTLTNAIFISESLRQDYQRAGFQPSNNVVIANGVPECWISTSSCEQAQYSSQPLRLLYVGRLEAEKGPDVAIKAVQAFVKRAGKGKITLDLIGNSSPLYLAQLQRFVRQADLEDAVHFVGALPREELMERYANYSVLLFPTLQWEGLGMVILEAMAKGLAVIASDIGGPRDLVVDRVNGFLVAPNQPHAMADVIEQLLKTPGLATRIGKEAVERVRRHYTLERSLISYEQFFQQQMNGSRNKFRMEL